MNDFNPSHLNRMDTQRLANYSTNLDFYQGTQWPTTSRNRQLVFNYTKVSIDKVTSFLMQGLNFACYPVGEGLVPSQELKARSRAGPSSFSARSMRTTTSSSSIMRPR